MLALPTLSLHRSGRAPTGYENGQQLRGVDERCPIGTEVDQLLSDGPFRDLPARAFYREGTAPVAPGSRKLTILLRLNIIGHNQWTTGCLPSRNLYSESH